MPMVNISDKDTVRRRATASGRIILAEDTVRAITEGSVKKGDVLTFAEGAALLAVKNVPNTIIHCHPIPITGIDVSFETLTDGIRVLCTVEADYRTGVEMEALAGVNAALLTIWDMVKYLEKDENGQYPTTRITDIEVVQKTKEALE